MQKLSSIIIFYRSLFLWSFAINLLIVIYNPELVSAIVTKLFITIITWYIMTHSNFKKKIIFYRNKGISALTLFSALFGIDALLTSGFILVMKEFI